MRRALISLSILIVALTASATAQAALPKVIGVALVRGGTQCSSGGCIWVGSYDSGLGSVTGSNVTAAVATDGNTVTFTAPSTVIVAMNSGLLGPTGSPVCTNGLGHSTCTMVPATYCRIGVHTDLGPDTITVRNPAATVLCEQNFGSPFDSSVSSGRGNDVINVREHRFSDVSCGLGYDVVYAEMGDHADPDCERVYRV
jgi:hypothetical protein